jgi:mRNA interferase HigB
MHIISRKALCDFWEIWPDAQPRLEAWFRIVELGKFEGFNALKAAFGSVDYVAPFTVFAIGGNRFRIITAIHYNRQKVYIRHVFTHVEYDAWSETLRKLKREPQKRKKL